MEQRGNHPDHATERGEKGGHRGVPLPAETFSCSPRLMLPSFFRSLAPLQQSASAAGAQATNNRLKICLWPSLLRHPLPPDILLRPFRGHKPPDVEGNKYRP